MAIVGGAEDPRFQNLSTSWSAPHHGVDWGDDLRAYERSKRHEVHPKRMEEPDLVIPRGVVANAERDFNPITQRFADKAYEHDLKKYEKQVAVEHLNRAEDLQILREQPYNVVNHASRLHGVESIMSPSSKRAGGPQEKRSMKVFPDTYQGRVDFNILSNRGYDEHHWAREDERPMPPLRLPRAREVPAMTVREFNILSNRYLEHHDEKNTRDEHLTKLESTVKDQSRNRFNPVTQTFKNQEEEDRMQVMDALHEQEIRDRRAAQEPPTLKHRPQAYFNPVNHAFIDEERVKWVDLANDERKLRYRTRYIAEHDKHNRDLAQDHQDEQRKMNRIHFDRYRTQIKRGHDIISNQHFEGRGGGPPFVPYPEEGVPPWQQAMHRGGKDHSETDEALMGTEVLKRRDNWVTSPRKKLDLSSSLSPKAKAPDANNVDGTILPEGFQALSSVASPKGNAMSPKAPQCEPIGPPLSERRSPSKGSSGLRGGSLSARGPNGSVQPAPPGKTGPVSKMPPPSHDGVASMSPSSKTPRMPSNSGVAPPAPCVPGTPTGSVFSRRL